MFAKFKSFATVLKSGAWVSTLTFLVTVATTSGVLDAGQVTTLKTSATGLLDLATGIVAIVHGFHVKSLLAATAPAVTEVPAAPPALVKASPVAAPVAPVVTAVTEPAPAPVPPTTPAERPAAAPATPPTPPPWA